MANEQTILITGATGQQGGAVLRHLKDTGFTLRAMTRKPEGDKGRALAGQGVEVVKGDLDDEASLRAALAGAWGVFAVQNTWEAGVEGEEQQGKRLAVLAKAAGVQHYVYTSVGSAHRRTGIPHFENKWRVEETVRAQRFPSHVIIRPVFFMENLLGSWFLNGDTLSAALKPTTELQMIAVDDIGRVGARTFTSAAALKGREIDIAGDTATMPRVVEVLSGALGRRIAFAQIPIEVVRKNSEDFALMLEWFERVGYNADTPALDREFGRMTRLDAWAGRAATRP
ncbi:MAG: NmrA family protein [Acidobacteria bacterium RIFCSPLOWO2_12_FULL_67_14]|nr:MAG: NmrA family protein [Acidobacteria bacterium RIFCSPLOWO2_02_FULL_67_21]OFW36524.1 MAG: NmrA family protein [Acidobacteria bacterium RIFCSPLOWO2_12_FULL_67_14]